MKIVRRPWSILSREKLYYVSHDVGVRVSLEIIFDLPFGFPINNIISLGGLGRFFLVRVVLCLS